MSISVMIMLGYGILLIAGGFIGYFIAGSSMSLVTGIVSGIAVQIATMLTRAGYEKASLLNCLFVLILIVFFAYRYWLTASFMPSGLMVFASLIALGASIALISRN